MSLAAPQDATVTALRLDASPAKAGEERPAKKDVTAPLRARRHRQEKAAAAPRDPREAKKTAKLSNIKPNVTVAAQASPARVRPMALTKTLRRHAPGSYMPEPEHGPRWRLTRGCEARET
jgi:hypothetical protein